jgi:hypothetical protein
MGVALPVARFDLVLNLRETPGGVEGAVEYNTDLFDRKTIAEAADRFLALLAEVTAHPEERIR